MREGGQMGIRLELRDASFRYDRGSDWVLKDVELSLGPGIYGLFGANGSGKTTLLQCIAGVRAWNSGRSGLVLGARSLRGRERRERIGYVSQESAYYEDMTVKAFLTYVARMKLIPDDLIAERIAEMLDCLNLTRLMDLRISSLSLGQKKRLSLAQALVNDPHLLLLDEVMEGLDMEERGAVMDMLHELSDGAIIILASHMLKELESWLDEVMFIADGRVLGPKTPQQWRWLLMQDAGLSDGSGRSLDSLEDVYMAAISG